MKSLFIISLLCSAQSLLALFWFSAVTIVPRPGVESYRAQMMLVAGAFAIAWLGLAFWARRRRSPATKSLPPQWLRRSLSAIGVVYLLVVFFCVFGWA
jgi:hypothetical protein